MNILSINKFALRTTAAVAVFTLLIGLVPLSPATAADIPSTATCIIVSDATTQEGGANSFVVERTSAWTPISGAEWIWGDATTNAAPGSQTFTKTFRVNGSSTNALLQIAADNGYIVRVNGVAVTGANTSAILNNYAVPAVYTITNYLTPNATNTLAITVVNAGTENNPAGLIYRLAITGSSCSAQSETATSTATSTSTGNGSLMIQKIIVGSTTNAVSNFSFNVQGATSTIAVIAGRAFESDGTNTVTVPVGVYNVREAGTLPAGFTASYRGCDAVVVASTTTPIPKCVITNTFATGTTTPSATTTPTGDTYELFGFVWEDNNSDGVINTGENPIGDWTVQAVNSTGEQVISDLTDASGRYSLNVPAGTWTISEITPRNWRQISGGNNGGTFVVTVPVVTATTTPTTPGTGTSTGTTTATTTNNTGTSTATSTNSGTSTSTATSTSGTGTSTATSTGTGTTTSAATTTTPLNTTATGTATSTLNAMTVVVRSFLNWLVPTPALAATLDQVGPFNFGNESRRSSGGGGSSRSSSGSGSSVTTNTTPAGSVLGASSTNATGGSGLGGTSTPTTTTYPTGAPNTGAGGTSVVVITLPMVNAIFETREITTRTKVKA